MTGGGVEVNKADDGRGGVFPPQSTPILRVRGEETSPLQEPPAIRCEPSWASDWAIGLRLWLERGGRAVLGDGRLELLEGIHSHRSISAAARNMGMSYRRAWLLVQDINEAAGLPLVEAVTGGRRGGGAHLTAQGVQAIALFRTVRQQLRQEAAALLPRVMLDTEAATVHVAAAVSLEEVLGQLLADYALHRPGLHVRTIYGASDELADLVLAGAPTDLLLAADPSPLDRLQAVGLVQPDSRALLAENSLAAIGLAGNPVPVRKPPDLLRLPHVAVAGPACPLGVYTRAYLQHLGLHDSLLSRAAVVDSSRSVVSAVRAGRAAAGLVYGSDAAHAEGCRVLFRVRRPPTPIRYSGAVVRRGQQADEARRLLDFLVSTRAAPRFRRCGFRSVTRSSR
jgi:molybdate transport system regulatory protein